MLENKRLAFIGAGAMAEAIISGLIKSGLSPQNIFASDINPYRLKQLHEKLQINFAVDNFSCTEEKDIIILAVKPQHYVEVLQEIRGYIKPWQLVISIAAGINTSFIERILGNSGPVIRVMPNTPALVGAGVSTIAQGKYSQTHDLAIAEEIFRCVGIVNTLPEKLIDAATGLSGSGPAYVYLVIEALADGGVKAGLPREMAIEMAAATLKGAAQMVLETNEHPAILKDKVTSPGGTTIEGLEVLEKAGVRGSLMGAVLASVNKAKAMADK